MSACPEKNLGGCYPIFFQVHALENLRWHPQYHFLGCRLNRRETQCLKNQLVTISQDVFIGCPSSTLWKKGRLRGDFGAIALQSGEFSRERYKISSIFGQRKLLLYFENSSTLISYVKNELNLSKKKSLNNIILGAHLCLLTFFWQLQFLKHFIF